MRSIFEHQNAQGSEVDSGELASMGKGGIVRNRNAGQSKMQCSGSKLFELSSYVFRDVLRVELVVETG